MPTFTVFTTVAMGLTPFHLVDELFSFLPKLWGSFSV
jgi:hypothetical protein